MTKVLFYFIKGLSLLPSSVLYVYAYFLHFLIKRIGYRKQVVHDNISRSFPEKSQTEVKEIANQFFRNFADYIVETIKGFTYSEKFYNKILTWEGVEEIDGIFNQNKNLMLLSGHVFNWEFLMKCSDFCGDRDTFAVYAPLSNEFLDKKVKDSRQVLGTKLISMKETKEIVSSVAKDGQSAFLFVADQSPQKHKITKYIDFLNQDTPVFTGYEKLVVKGEMGVIYAHIVKEKTGKFHVKFIRIHPDNGVNFEKDELVLKYHALLEENIKQSPATYLWTHKKWKHARG